ncbi:LysE family translocator [Diaphorobacter sp. HDW4B]|uniref:LysE family translocator n=1 Tax=Diaphorobacter sp. HDW4B TaxID=2714925 RepID=UPI0014094A26|nr:LysE family translocator [Diaphorobacter sp. HDW4B]QIL71591.1 LysE family translocator [Diaphorobacter sp. HDW4B]
MLDLQLLSLFALAFFTAVLIPGPNVALAVTQSIKYGLKRAIPGAWGFGLATGIHAATVFAGVGVFINEHPIVLTALRWFGVAYILHLAYGALTDLVDENASEGRAVSSMRIFSSSLLASLTSPKGWLVSILIYPSFIQPQLPYWPQTIAVIAVAVLISLATYGGYMMAADRAQTLFRNQQQLHRVAGCLYVLVAVGLLLSIFNVI